MSSRNDYVEAKAYTKKDLVAIYGISTRTMTTWLAPFLELIGKKQGRYYNVNQVRAIFDKLGLPGTINC